MTRLETQVLDLLREDCRLPLEAGGDAGRVHRGSRGNN